MIPMTSNNTFSDQMSMQLRLITDLLPYLLPGVQTEFPHTPVAFATSATSVPQVAFVRDSGMLLSASFQVIVYVLPHSASASQPDKAAWHREGATSVHASAEAAAFQPPMLSGWLPAVNQMGESSGKVPSITTITAEAAGSRESAWVRKGALQRPDSTNEGIVGDMSVKQDLPGNDGSKWLGAMQHGQSTSHDVEKMKEKESQQSVEKVQVARLHANASLLVNVGFDTVDLPTVDIRFETIESRYNLTPAHWDQTVQWVLQEARQSFGLRALYKQFIGEHVWDMFKPENVISRYREGWYQVSADVHLNTSSIPMPELGTSIGLLGNVS
jgi:hypothetical protein